MLCAGGVTGAVNAQLLTLLKHLLAVERPPLTVAILQKVRDAGEERDRRLSATDAAFGGIHEVLSPHEKALFLYVNVPRETDGCAILWGRAFRRGVVAAEPIPWVRLRATILNALGATPDYRVDDVIKEGEMVEVVVLEVDQAKGRIRLSRKALLEKAE